MLPTLAPIMICPGGGGGPSSSVVGIWTTVPSSSIQAVSNLPVVDEGVVFGLLDQSGQFRDAIQSAGVFQPVAEDDKALGAFMIRFQDNDYLECGTTDLDIYWVAVAGLVSGGARVFAARDTSQAGTTKSAWELAVVEDLQ